jgi:thiamine biosynthesis protein ThiI
MMDKIILVRYGEIILKGLNRSSFEDKLITNIKRRIYPLGKVIISKSQARIIIEPETDNYDFDAAIEKLIKIFGIVSVSLAYKVESNLEVIKKTAETVVNELMALGNYRTFKVESKRGDKKFPYQSPAISAEIGGHILEQFDFLTVDVNNPSFSVYVEVRESSFVYSKIIPAFCGMPTGTNGKAMTLLSGGIDSPVSSFMIAKRGVELEAIHFYSYPYTSERAKQKVIDLAKIVASYSGRMRLHVVPFTELQLEMNDKCPLDMLTIVMRRVMMKISETIARNNNCSALVTGESIGQVASQTMQSLYVTNMVVEMPVFRPLIGMDKNEVIDIARKIGTFETSILPYEDCCTVFVAKHPKTKPQLKDVDFAEANLHIDEMIDKAIKETEIIIIE